MLGDSEASLLNRSTQKMDTFDTMEEDFMDVDVDLFDSSFPDFGSSSSKDYEQDKEPFDISNSENDSSF